MKIRKQREIFLVQNQRKFLDFEKKKNNGRPNATMFSLLSLNFFNYIKK